MHDEMYKPDLSEVCQIEKDLIAALRTAVSHGVFSKDVDAKELGELVDMVKDMAETKRNCWEACYYETVTMAMKEDEEAMGYNPNRYSSGRYAPSGTGNRTGYMPYVPPMYYPKMPMDDIMRPGDVIYGDGIMGYSGGNGRGSNGNGGSSGSYNGGGNGSSGYSRQQYKDHRGDRYGESFREYEDAKRHYTESHSLEDKSHMDEKAREHVNDSMMTLREIWKEADPAVKKEVAASIASLASEFKSV